MATVRPATVPVELFWSLSTFKTGAVTSLTSSSYLVEWGSEGFSYQVTGTGFLDSDADGRPDTGTVTSIAVYEAGTLVFTISDIGRTVADLYAIPDSDVLANLLSGNDTIVGSSGDDSLSGYDGSDRIYAGSGNDTISGSFGNAGGTSIDQAFGGTGDDSFFYSFDNGPFIIDGGAGVDRWSGSVNDWSDDASVEIDVSMAASSTGLTLPDGSVIRNVEAVLFMTGAGDDTFTTGATARGYSANLGLGDDVAYVSSGSGSVSSGAHSDDDVAEGFLDWDVVFVDFSDATSALSTRNAFHPTFFEPAEWRQYTTSIGQTSAGDGATVGVAAGTFDELHVIGSAFGDQLAGGPSNDFLFGGGGADVFTAQLGDDVIHGGPGSDWLNFRIADANNGDFDDWSVTSGASINLGVSTAQVLPSFQSSAIGWASGSLGIVTLTSIENVEGTPFADNFIGNTASNQLLGMAGNDRLLGNAGNDILDGGTGNDAMRGGLGDDTYYIDNSGDRAIERVGEGLDQVYASFSYALAANLENLALIGTARNGSGNSLANRIIGNDSDNIINGYAGADSMRGGAGDDTYYVDDAGDRIVENADEGVDRVYSMVTYSATLNVDQVFLRGTAAINASGNGLDNVLVGNSAANILNGRFGADDLRGGSGADTFYFDNGHFGGLTASTCDRILDFSHADGDRIDLADVDANSVLADHQTFEFIGTDAFSNVAGQLRFEQVNGNTYVYGDIDGNGVADLMIRLDGNQNLVGGDFIL